MRNHTYEWDNVIVGMTLPACLYAYDSGYPIVGFQYDRPSVIDNQGSDLAQWTDLIFTLSMRGQIPFSDNVSSIALDGNELSIVTKRSLKQCRARFKKIHLFSDYMVHGLPPIKEEGCLKKVYDWIDVRSIQSHDLDFMEVTKSSDILREIHFVKTGRSNNRDICAVFLAHTSTLKDFDCSPTMIRIEVERILKAAGLTGPLKNNISETRKSPTYAPMVLESSYREVRPASPNCYVDSENIVCKFEMSARPRTKKNFTKDPFLTAHLEDS